MGNTSSNPPPEREEILIHSFLLDADYDTCQLPLIFPRKNAMFQTPAVLDDNVQEFLRLEEAEKILADLNKILRLTAFNPTVFNPCFLLAVVASYGILSLHHSSSDEKEVEYEWEELTVGEEEEEEEKEEEERSKTILWILPYLCFVVIVLVAKFCRKRKLTNYVAEWNSRGNGVTLSFGGVGTTARGVTVGSEFGGTYDNFNMAMRDPKGHWFKGYLHVFVNTGERQHWCSANGTSYVAPIPLGEEAPVQIVVYQPPPGYALVPLAELQTTGNTSAPPPYEKATV